MSQMGKNEYRILAWKPTGRQLFSGDGKTILNQNLSLRISNFLINIYNKIHTVK
jgi:hypothetical protein